MNDTARLDALEARMDALEDDAVEASNGSIPTGNYAELVTLLLAAGCPNGMPRAGAKLAALKGLGKGLTAPLLAEHWITMVNRYFGGDWNRATMAGHGANWRLPKERIAELLAGIGIGDAAWSSEDPGVTEPLPDRPSRGTEYGGPWDGKEPE